LASVKFDDEALITVATSALDALAGMGQHMNRWPAQIRQPTGGRIIEQRQLAMLAVDAWRASRNPKP
jgi:hypothetical protein